MLSHLHTQERAPVAYIRYLFYKEFGWTPDEVRAIPLPVAGAFHSSLMAAASTPWSEALAMCRGLSTGMARGPATRT